MALSVYNAAMGDGEAPFRDYTWTDVPLVATWTPKGPGQVTGLALAPYALREWSWGQGLTDAQRIAFQAFFATLDWVRAPFLLRDPRDLVRRVTLEPAVGDGGRTLFSLPTVEADADYLFYPLNNAEASGVVAGVPGFALAFVNTDARTVQFAAPPGIGLAVALDYRPLRLARVKEAVELASMMQTYVHATLSLEQLVRDP